MPDFNIAEMIAIPENVKRYNVPVYGLNISKAVFELFTLPEMNNTAEMLNVRILPEELNKVVQGKMEKVLDMVQHCQKAPGIAGENAGATQKLRKFVEEFQALDQDMIN